MHKPEIFLVCLAVGFCLSSKQARGQATTYSPYSAFGLGDRQYLVHGRAAGMGGLGIGIIDRFSMNPRNPASYSSVAEVSFDFYGYYSSTKLETAQRNNLLNSGGIQGFGFVFPAAKKWAFGLGLAPYSALGYSVRQPTTVVQDTITYSGTSTREGEGGLNDFYIGASFKPHPNISLGTNLSYVFGSLNETYTTQLNGLNANPLAMQNTAYVRGLANRVGVLLNAPLGNAMPELPDTAGLDTATANRIHAKYQRAYDKWDANQLKGRLWALRIGLTGQFFFASGYDKLRTIRYDNGAGGASVTDTISFVDGIGLRVPAELGTGISLEQQNRWLFGLDFTYQNWADFRLLRENDQLRTAMIVSGGAEWIPNWGNARKFWGRLAFRAGGSWQQTALQLAGKDITGYSATIGVGIPVIKVRSRTDMYSRVNIGVEYKSRGTTENGLVRESGYRVVFGVSVLQPWFRQWRYD